MRRLELQVCFFQNMKKLGRDHPKLSLKAMFRDQKAGHAIEAAGSTGKEML